MGIIRKIAGFLGISRDDDVADVKDVAGAAGTATVGGGDINDRRSSSTARSAGEMRGFGVKMTVVAERPNLGPLIVPCDLGDGGVQGFKWYTSRLRIDEDGDVADEFLDEVMRSSRPSEHGVTPHKLQTNYRTLPTAMAMRKQVMVADGNLRQSLEYQEKLKWV